MNDSKKVKILIDTDIGLGTRHSDTDDGLALLYALAKEELDVAAVTTVAGNVPADVATINAHNLLGRVGRQDLPLGHGAALPLRGVNETLERRWKGMADKSQARDVARLKRTTPDSVDLILETIKKTSGGIVLVPIGPLTNVAVAFLKDPKAFRKLDRIVLMGGSAGAGNVTPVAEFNAWCDPEAADIVFRSGVKVTMFGLDITTRLKMRPASIERWKRKDSPFLNFLHAACSAYMVFRSERFGDKEPSAFYHDVMPVAYLANPGLFTVAPCHVDVETAGVHTRGMTVLRRRGEPLDHEFAADLDCERFEAAVLGGIETKYKTVK